MAAINPKNLLGALRQPIQPRNGFPVQNMGGLPRSPVTAPPKPFITQPTVGAPPGPAPGGLLRGAPLPAGFATNQAPINAPVGPPGQPVGGTLLKPPANMPAGPYLATTGPAPTIGSQPPAPVPAAPLPGAPAPTSAPPPGSSTTTASSGQTGVLSQPAQGDLEGQIRDYLSGAFKGSVTPEFLQRAKEQVFRNVSGQTRQATNRVNEDAIRRGLFRSGIPAEGIANVEAAGQGAMASGVADILNAAEAQNIQGRQAAAGTAGELLSANRSWQQYQDQKAAADAARRAAGAPKTFTYIDPDTGQSYQMDESWF